MLSNKGKFFTLLGFSLALTMNNNFFAGAMATKISRFLEPTKIIYRAEIDIDKGTFFLQITYDRNQNTYNGKSWSPQQQKSVVLTEEAAIHTFFDLAEEWSYLNMPNKKLPAEEAELHRKLILSKVRAAL